MAVLRFRRTARTVGERHRTRRAQPPFAIAFAFDFARRCFARTAVGDASVGGEADSPVGAPSRRPLEILGALARQRRFPDNVEVPFPPVRRMDGATVGDPCTARSIGGVAMATRARGAAAWRVARRDTNPATRAVGPARRPPANSVPRAALTAKRARDSSSRAAPSCVQGVAALAVSAPS
ncbi:unnamed protein product [Lampetra fluviatilis]